jgi:serine phosphatase RsbU (regulator of sigma subunit)
MMSDREWSPENLDVGVARTPGDALQLRRLAHECSERAAALPPLAFRRYVDECAATIADPMARQVFLAHAESLFQQRMNRHLDEEVMRLQEVLGAVSAELATISRQLLVPLGLDAGEDMPITGQQRAAMALPNAIEASLGVVRERMGAVRRDMAEAAATQQRLLPRSAQVTTQAAQLAAYYRPASACGGDWWTHARLPGGKLLVVVGDVTGHGPAAAILTGVAKAACEMAVADTPELRPDELLQRMNRVFYSLLQGEVLMTCVASVIDPGIGTGVGTVLTARAGHPYPYVLHGRGAERDLRQIVVKGSPLGATDHADFECVAYPIAAGDLLLWYSDGVPECAGKSPGEVFREKRLQALLRGSEAGNAMRLRDDVVAALMAFSEGTVVDDDITLVAGMALPMA